MNVTAFGLDYSARELTPAEIDTYNASNPPEQISFLIRYIGYSSNPKCISHYPGALAEHEANGTLVLLVHQIGYLDFHGGYEAGRQHAIVALADARRQGYPEDRPIFFAFDRWLAGNPAKGIPALSIGKVWEYLAGAQSVLGGERVGLYGFHDVIHPAIREGRVRWTWLCGAESGVIEGLDFYQWNNGRRYPGRPVLETDLNKSYRDLSQFGGGDTLLADERNAVMSTHAAIFYKGGDQGDQSMIERLVEIQLHERANAIKLDQLLGRQPGDVDENELAKALAPLLRGLPDEGLDALSELVSKKTNDERDRRERERLEVKP